MDPLKDQTYLKTEQYKDSSNLHARATLHARFNTNTCRWHPWVFDHLLTLASNSHILELGCGPCYLWQENHQRIPNGWIVVLSDLSPSMLAKAQQNLASADHSFAFQEIDAQTLPFPDRSQDAVVANHMLYHVPALSKTLSEIQRVLKPGGRLFAATVGQHHMRQVGELRQKFDQMVDVPLGDDHAGRYGEDDYTLENGQRLLSPWFPEVVLYQYESRLEVTEVEPLYEYMMSGLRYQVSDDRKAEFRAFLTREMAAAGGMIRIDGATWLFEATR